MRKISMILLVIAGLFPFLENNGQGISFDAGLTPAQGRIIVRTQYRHFSAEANSVTATTRMVPVVVAYGLRPDITLMARNMYFHRSFSGSDVNVSGINDPYLLAKFRLYRKNTAAWVLGVAPHIGVNLPLGAPGVGSETWNPDLGLNISFRPRFFSVDFSLNYRVNDITVISAGSQPDQLSTNLAASHIMALNASGDAALAPVVEINYFRDVNVGENQGAGGQFLMVSPGFSFITSGVTFEGLVQLPVYQESAMDVRQKYRIIAGVKFLF